MVDTKTTRATVQKKYILEGYNPDRFEDYWDEYQACPNFKINENVETVGGISEESHFIMRCLAQEKMKEVFSLMKIDLSDDNVTEDQETGNIGTPGRIIKMWTGKDLHDDRELLSGRWSKKPRLAKFPNTHQTHIPISKRVDLTAVCSHHAAPFSTTFREDAYAIISYIPEDFVLGISKLQRLTDWISQRGWLQEELSQKIYDEISEVAETDSVYVRLYNVVHTCESLRGAKSKDGAFTSEYYGGKFNKAKLRKEVK